MTFVWLASYPKSGNTWLRILLSNYLTSNGQEWRWDSPLRGPPSHLERHRFDEEMGIASGDIPADSFDSLRRQLHAQFVGRFPGTSFAKTHEAFFGPRDGLAMFPAEPASKAIYLVRNPLDIAASYAHHEHLTIDEAIEHLADPAAKAEYNDAFFAEHLGSWSTHVGGWTQQDQIETLIVRFEDLVSDAAESFGKIARFCGLEIDNQKVAQAIASSSFKRLQALEDESGFRALSDASRRFFRKGRSGGWRTELTAEQSKRIHSDHSEMMGRLAYRSHDDA